MLIIGDLSGIQEFLFDVREAGGKQAASLRFRSFRLQIIAECLARRFLWGCGLNEESLLFVAAGKFIVDADGVTGAVERVKDAHSDAQQWLLRHTHGRLRFAVAIESAGSSVVDKYHLAMASLRRSKLNTWSASGDNGQSWVGSALVADAPWDASREAERDAAQGHQLLDADVVTLAPIAAHSNDDSDAIAGVMPSWRRRHDLSQEGNPVTIDLARLLRHIPTETDGRPTEFISLASVSSGDPMLGVLKADADSLGMAIRRQLDGAGDLAPLRTLSNKLENFFGAQLDSMMSSEGSHWSCLYTVFSGGDDLLLVGPWDVVLDFAAHMRQAFSQAFADEQLTISAGMALIKPKFPIRLAAQQVEEMLEEAKTMPAVGATTAKDQFVGLGGCWKWTDHNRIIDAGKQLADWIRGDIIQRGHLHTLLELTLLQRSQDTVQGTKIIPEMASSRLAYHVARNWSQASPARLWIDMLRPHLDRFPNTQNPLALHLPSILRYAILATRAFPDKE